MCENAYLSIKNLKASRALIHVFEYAEGESVFHTMTRSKPMQIAKRYYVVLNMIPVANVSRVQSNSQILTTSCGLLPSF